MIKLALSLSLEIFKWLILKMCLNENTFYDMGNLKQF